MLMVVFVIFVFVGLLGYITFSYMVFHFKKRNILHIENDLKNGRHDKAIKALKSLINKNHSAHNAHRLLGDAYMAIDNKKLAINEYQLALRGVDKEMVEYEISIRKKLVEGFIGLENDKAAIEELLLLLKLEDTNSVTYHRLSKLYLKLGNPSKALNYMKMAIKYDESNSSLYYDLGILYYDLNRHHDAVVEFKKCLDRNRTHVEANYYIGSCYRHMGDYSAALPFFRIVGNKKAFRMRALLNQGICYLYMSNVYQAEEAFNGVIENTQTIESRLRLHAHYYLGVIYEQRNDIVIALKSWEFINKIDTNFKDVPEKLVTYSDLRNSDLIKDYMVCSLKEFKQLNLNMLRNMQLVLHEAKETDSNEKLCYICREEVRTILVTKALFKYVVFNRSSQMVDENEVRDCLESSKRFRCSEVIYITISGAIPSCIEYIKSRPVRFIFGNELNLLLKKISDSRII